MKREELERVTNTNKQGKGPYNIADMKITFGTDGSVVKIADVNPDKLANLNVTKNIVKAKIQSKHERTENDTMARMRQLRESKKKDDTMNKTSKTGSEAAFGNSVDDS